MKIAAGCLVAGLVIYTYFDNNRIIVDQQVVYIENLPVAFEDFKILQLSDLHGKYFGKHQEKLAGVVNSTHYDIAIFTGDMESGADFSAFTDLLDQMGSQPRFYINGNDDRAYSTLNGSITGIGRILEDHGCIMLNQPYIFDRGGSRLWLVNDLTKSFYFNYDVYQGLPAEYFSTDKEYQAYAGYYSGLNHLIARIKGNQDIKIGITHIPFTRGDLDGRVKEDSFLDYDLILAGHYHGGQIVIPGYGAVVIPSKLEDSFFPDQYWVSGLIRYLGFQQYVSHGLGASNIPFRMFDTPEINLITLKPESSNSYQPGLTFNQ